MAVSLYMDVHVPQPITDQLRRRGIDVLTAIEDGWAERDDDELLEHAGALGPAFSSVRRCWLATFDNSRRRDCARRNEGLGDVVPPEFDRLFLKHLRVALRVAPALF